MTRTAPARFHRRALVALYVGAGAFHLRLDWRALRDHVRSRLAEVLPARRERQRPHDLAAVLAGA
jgi:hypothetical protein